jgi:hypothetical protein
MKTLFKTTVLKSKFVQIATYIEIREISATQFDLVERAYALSITQCATLDDALKAYSATLAKHLR